MKIIKTALSQYGVKETPDGSHHPQIEKYFSVLGFDSKKLKEDTGWCSAFVNWVAKTTGYEYSGKLNARSWLSVGFSTDTPAWGDIVILWRESPASWKGHVGFYIKESKRYVYLLGGNQGSRVCIKAFPKKRILDYKRLRKHG